jgi:CheY-like chemotaxis protein
MKTVETGGYMPISALSRPLNVSALVIETHPDSASLVQAVLEPWGITVLRASSTAEAATMIGAVRPEIILCDIAPPHADGLDFLRRLRASADPRLRTVPAIAMSAAYEDIDARTARAAGFDVFLRKPIDPDELPHTVAALIGLSTERARDLSAADET